MKIIIKKSSLEACVKNLAKVINRKNALPILGDILFDVNDQEKTVRLTASDSEIWLNYQPTKQRMTKRPSHVCRCQCS